MDDRFREALQRAAAGEPPAGDGFARFEAARRRANLVRTAVVVAMGVAIVAAFTWVFPNPFTSGSPANFQAGGPLSPQPRNVNRYADPAVRFELSFPLRWGAIGKSAHLVTFTPPAKTDDRARYELARCTDCKGEVPIVRPKRFYVEVDPLRAGTYPTPGRALRALERNGATVLRLDDFTVAGVAAAVWRYEIPNEPVANFARYCVRCAVVEVIVPWEKGWTVFARAIAPSAAALEAGLPEFQELVESIGPYVERPYD